MLNLIAIDLQLYKIFRITRISSFGTHCSTKVENLIKMSNYRMMNKPKKQQKHKTLQK